MRIFIVIILFAGLGLAGNYADSFIESAASPLVISLAGSNSAVDTSTAGAVQNPAALSPIHHLTFELMYNRQFGLADAGYINCVYPISTKSAMAINWILFSVNDIIQRPDLFSDSSLSPEERRQKILLFTGMPNSTFSDLESATILTFTHRLRSRIYLPWSYNYLNINCPLGINLKYIHKHMGNNIADGLGVDLGIRFTFSLGKLLGNEFGHFYTGITLKDLGKTQIYWNSQHTDLIQQQIIVSGAFCQELIWLKSHISISGSWNTRYPDELACGLDWSVARKIHLRVGYCAIGWQTGCGLLFNWHGCSINLDYGLLPHDLNNSHRISFSIAMK